jgi:hypothetical protein
MDNSPQIDGQPKHAHSLRLLIRDDVYQYYRSKAVREQETLSLIINKALLQLIKDEQTLLNL